MEIVRKRSCRRRDTINKGKNGKESGVVLGMNVRCYRDLSALLIEDDGDM